MSSLSTQAILLRRIDHSDFDIIITFFTRDRGKIPVIAKAAKKSVKRFSGILELFSVLHIVYTTGRNKGLPVLQEADIEKPFAGIRTDIKKTAYASYWAELIYLWAEEGKQLSDLYYLLYHVLEGLDLNRIPDEELSVFFQVRFLAKAGLSPYLSGCGSCGKDMDRLNQALFMFDLAKGSLVCEKCFSNHSGGIRLSKGTVKQLIWAGSGDLKKAGRARFSKTALKESQGLLEAFIPYHLGREPKSLIFLRSIRK